MKRILALLFLLISSAFSYSQEAVTPEQADNSAAPAAVQPAEAPSYLSSPRASFSTFVDAMEAARKGDDSKLERALETLDLSGINPLVRKTRGVELAWMLSEIIRRVPGLSPQRVSASEKANTQRLKAGDGSLILERNENGRWQFSAETVSRLPELLDQLPKKESGKNTGETEKSFIPWSIRLRQMLPESLRQEAFLLENWQWLGLFLVVLLGVIADKLLSWILKRMVVHWRDRSENREFHGVSE